MLIKEKVDDILIITLNRPEKRNALNPQLIKQLHQIVKELKLKDDIFGLLLTGSGNTFCAGADLEYLESLLHKSFDEHLEDSRDLKNLFYDIFTLPKPVVALVNGPALAGGCGLANVCDYAIASKDARFGYPEVKIGFTAAIVSVFLMHTVGLYQAKQLLMEGEIFDSQRALELGLIKKIVKSEELGKCGIEFINELRSASASSLALTKQLLLQLNQQSIESALEAACRANAEARMRPDFREGVRSFLEKRKPRWGNRE